VLYEQDDPDKVVLKVPMYEDCSLGAGQLTEAWRHVSSGQAVLFKNTKES
jgi:hypothetical protein